MVSASCFVAADGHAVRPPPGKKTLLAFPVAQGSSANEAKHADRPALALTEIAQAGHWVCRTAKFSVVVVLHVGLLAWIAQASPPVVETVEPIRLDVRTVEMPAAAAARPQAISTPVVKTPLPAKKVVLPNPVRPSPQPLLQALPAASAPPTSFSMPSAAAPDMEQGDTRPISAAPPSAATGGIVSTARYDADYLKNPAPEYPSLSRRMREQGTVHLDVTVTPDGAAKEVKLSRSSGYARLDEAALETVRRWRFVPARKGDEAITANVIVPIAFRLAG